MHVLAQARRRAAVAMAAVSVVILSARAHAQTPASPGQPAPVAEAPASPSAAQPAVDPFASSLKVLCSVPGAEVFIDGQAAGPAPVDKSDLEPGKHYVVVRKAGHLDWKKEIVIEAGTPLTVSAELTTAAALRVEANVPGAEVLVDGRSAGRTPLTVDGLEAGSYSVEIKAAGYQSALKRVSLQGGEQKVLSAELAREGASPSSPGSRWSMSAREIAQRRRTASTFGAITLEPRAAAIDITAGFVPFAHVRLVAGAYRWKSIGIDAGVEFRTIGYLNVAGAHMRLELWEAGPFSIGSRLFIGGGGGPTKRNTIEFELGVPISLSFSKYLRLTGQPYLQLYSDRLCPSNDDLDPAKNRSDAAEAAAAEPAGCRELPPVVYQDPRTRWTGARLVIQAALEIMINDWMNVVAIFEGAVPDGRAVLSTKYSPDFVWKRDPQMYGRIGVTFKF